VCQCCVDQYTHRLTTFLQATAQAADDYNRLLALSMQFYQAQMSGALPDWNSISWRKSAHLTDGADAQLDLVGGFYDAGGEAIAAVLQFHCLWMI
jgi:hypothetical protein